MRDLAAQNLALGSKLLWNIVSGNPSWSKRVLWKKYFHVQRLRCLDQPPRISKGSPVFKLFLTALKLFSHKLYWILGNGKKIKIWEDSILGDQPLNHMEELVNIRVWLQASNMKILWDISNWKDKVWLEWMKLDLPSDLENTWLELCSRLKGKAPTHEEKHD